jgi:hypothetical protein
MLHNIYGAAIGKSDEWRYSPAVCTGIDLRPVTGNPDMNKASTFYVEGKSALPNRGCSGRRVGRRVRVEVFR